MVLQWLFPPPSAEPAEEGSEEEQDGGWRPGTNPEAITCVQLSILLAAASVSPVPVPNPHFPRPTSPGGSVEYLFCVSGGDSFQ